MDQNDSEDRQWAGHDHFPATVVATAQAEKAEYAQGVDRPLGTYAALTTAYATLAVGLGLAARRRHLAPEMTLAETVLATVATANFARTTAKDPVTSFLRAPFTRFKGQAGEAELAEEVRGTGPRHGIGELLTCPFCLGPWFAGAFVAGFTFAPGAARAAALIGTMSAGADVFQYGFAGLQEAWKRFSEGENED
jgi:hypothetical protein